MHRRTCVRLLLVAFGTTALTAAAQQPSPAAGAAQDLGPATERGLRFTPGMARGIAEMITNEVFVREFELDKAKAPEVSEALARRMVVAINSNEEALASLDEFLIVAACEANVRQKDGGEGFSFGGPVGKEFAERVLPMLPTLKGLMRDITQDVRPHLPFKQQLKLTAGMATVMTGVDAFGNNLQRFANGEAGDDENPFNFDPTDNPNAKTAVAQRAQQAAQKEPDKETSVRSVWESYLKQFKEFYALDPAQSATADSILREYTDRARTTFQDAAWRDAISRTRLWLNMASALRFGWGTPIMSMLDKRYEKLMEPVNTLGDDFRQKLEGIPTSAQRQAADARITKLLAAHGYSTTTRTAEAN